MKRKSPFIVVVIVVVLMTALVAQIEAHKPNPPSPFSIQYFTADRTIIEPGGCVTLSYWVVGGRRITLHGSNWRSGPEVITDNPNQRVVCPSAAAGYVPGAPVTYTLRVVYLNGHLDRRSVTIFTAPISGTPVPTPAS